MYMYKVALVVFTFLSLSLSLSLSLLLLLPPSPHPHRSKIEATRSTTPQLLLHLCPISLCGQTSPHWLENHCQRWHSEPTHSLPHPPTRRQSQGSHLIIQESFSKSCGAHQHSRQLYLGSRIHWRGSKRKLPSNRSDQKWWIFTGGRAWQVLWSDGDSCPPGRGGLGCGATAAGTSWSGGLIWRLHSIKEG